MDPTVNPCDDFFNFACGSWIEENIIPEDKSKIDGFLKSALACRLNLKVLILKSQNRHGLDYLENYVLLKNKHNLF